MNKRLTNLLSCINSNALTYFEIEILWEAKAFWNFFRPIDSMLNELIRNRMIYKQEIGFSITTKGINYLKQMA